VKHALPGHDDGPTSGFNLGGRNRSDITNEKPLQSDQELQKKLAYQEELRMQMLEIKAKKEREKQLKKEEDE
jgi:hypothetical protein